MLFQPFGEGFREEDGLGLKEDGTGLALQNRVFFFGLSLVESTFLSFFFVLPFTLQSSILSSRSPPRPNFPAHAPHLPLHPPTHPSTMYPSPPSLQTPSTLLHLLILIAPGSAYVTWLYPPASSSRALAYNYNDVVYFSWESNFTAPSITLWCASDDSYYSREWFWFFLFSLSLFLFLFLQPPPASQLLPQQIHESHHKDHAPFSLFLITISLTPPLPTTVYTANVTTNGTDPQSFPYSASFNQSCHMTLYCHNSSDCGPRGQSPEFALAHNNAAAAQTWGLAATASVGKAVAATGTTTTTSSSTTSSSSAAAKTASATAGNAAVVTGETGAGTGPAIPSASHGGLSVGAKAGIGVGVAVGAVVVVALLWFLVAKTRGMGTGRRDRGTPFGVPEMMGGQEYARHAGWVEQPRHEMSGEGRIDELQGTPQAELSSVASPVRYG